jgi:hypothetical protein
VGGGASPAGIGDGMRNGLTLALNDPCATGMRAGGLFPLATTRLRYPHNQPGGPVLTDRIDAGTLELPPETNTAGSGDLKCA